MNTIVIRFTIRKAIVTWYVNENWVILISFLITILTGVAFKIIKRRLKIFYKKIKICNPRVVKFIYGKFVDECIEPNSIYEVVDPALELVIKQMLNISPTAGPMII